LGDFGPKWPFPVPGGDSRAGVLHQPLAPGPCAWARGGAPWGRGGDPPSLLPEEGRPLWRGRLWPARIRSGNEYLPTAPAHETKLNQFLETPNMCLYPHLTHARGPRRPGVTSSRRAVRGPGAGGHGAPPRGVDVKQPPAGRPGGPRGPGRRLRSPEEALRSLGAWDPWIPRSGDLEDPGRGPAAPGQGSLGTRSRSPAGVAFTSTPRGGALRPSGTGSPGPGSPGPGFQGLPGGQISPCPWQAPDPLFQPPAGDRAPPRGVDVKPPLAVAAGSRKSRLFRDFEEFARFSAFSRFLELAS